MGNNTEEMKENNNYPSLPPSLLPSLPSSLFFPGNEVIGVDTLVLEECDGGIIEIPTFGQKNSLNVASAAPVVVFEVLRQWGVFGEKKEGNT